MGKEEGGEMATRVEHVAVFVIALAPSIDARQPGGTRKHSVNEEHVVVFLSLIHISEPTRLA